MAKKEIITKGEKDALLIIIEDWKRKYTEAEAELKKKDMILIAVRHCARCSECPIPCGASTADPPAEPQICKYCGKPIEGELDHLICEPAEQKADISHICNDCLFDCEEGCAPAWSSDGKRCAGFKPKPEPKGWTEPQCQRCGGPMVHAGHNEHGQNHRDCMHWFCEKCKVYNWPAGLDLEDACPVCEPKGK